MITSSQQLTPRFTGVPPDSTDHDPCVIAATPRRLTPSGHDEDEVRRQIDRAVGQALVDRSFAARLLSHPALAVQKEACEQTQYLALRQIRTDMLDDFARKVFDQFWGSAYHPVT